MNLSPNTTFAHYRIVSKLGAGGMGEVYLAHDTKLDRKVAIKFLNEEFSKDSDKLNRFIQEAKSASALNHPNILTVHEIGEIDGREYIATEFIDGRTLRESLSPEDTLSLNTILKIGVQVAEALSAAHAAGIIHRDIKPENIMIRRDGYAKVLDFGLAKLTDGHGDTVTRRHGDESETMIAASQRPPVSASVNTAPGMIMGTVSYMSPEQARGNPTDARTDLWSLGVVLYEMIARRVPFTGETVNHTIVAILEREPAQLENAPSELQRIVRKALTKDLDMRYQSARDLLIDLKNLRRDLDIQGELERSVVPNNRDVKGTALSENETRVIDSVGATRSGQVTPTQNVRSTSSLEYAVTQAKSHKLASVIVVLVLLAGVTTAAYFRFASRSNKGGQINSIAVLPFVNEGGNVDLEYLSDGMTETLMSSLAQIPNLNVKARSLVFRYKNKETNPQTVGRELEVQAILNGRLVPRGTDLVLYLELVDTTTGNLIWSDQYNRKQTDLVSLQSDIARDVSSKLRTRLTGAEEQKLAKSYTENSEAYKFYLQGRYLANKRTPNDAKRAAVCFEQAIKIDPNYALAYWALGTVQSYLTIYGDAPAKETLPKARELAIKAIELDGSLAEPHVTLGVLLFLLDHNFAGYERELQRALELNPNLTDTHRLNGFRLTMLGKHDEAIAELKRALEIEPLSAAGNANYAWALFYSGRIDEGEAQAKRCGELFPDFWLAHYFLSIVYRYRGNYALAVEEFARMKELREEGEAAKLVRDSFAKGGWKEFLTTVTTQQARIKSSPYYLATFYAELGDKDHAFAALNDAVENADQFIGLIKVDPFMKPLQSDPRYQPLVKKVGLPE